MNLCQCGCGKETKSSSSRFCRGHNGRDPEVQKKRKLSYIKRYGTDNPSKSKEVQDQHKKCWKNKTNDQLLKINQKRKNTCQERYNVDNPMKVHDIQKNCELSCFKNNGVRNPLQSKEIQEQRKQNCLSMYGVEHISQREDIKKKKKETCLEHFGVNCSSQDPVIHRKQQKSCFHRKKYILPSGKEILLQGEEPSFLDCVFSNNLLKEDEIDYKPQRIKYRAEGKDHYYFADFKIVPFNLIVEIKSWYILSIQKNTDLKIAATKALGHNYIMILDKKYDEFKNLIHQLSEQNQKVGV
jgi:hypothetical protein